VNVLLKKLLEVLLWNCGRCAPEYLFKVALCVYCCCKRCLWNFFADSAQVSWDRLKTSKPQRTTN